MGFAIIKALLPLILPPGSLLLIGALGILVVKKHPACGRCLTGTSLLVLYLLSTGFVADRLMRPLEEKYPPLAAETPRADAVVVLTDGARDVSWIAGKPQPSEQSLQRLVAGIQLSRKLRHPLVISGGSGDPSKPGISEAGVLADTAASLGVDRKKIIIEGSSRNTKESAEALKKLLSGKRIVLVTSAWHLKRASALFVKQGFSAIPAPSGYLGERLAVSWSSFLPKSGHLHTSAVALHEYISYQWYKKRGDL